MWKVADKRVRMVLRRYENDHERQIRNAPKKNEVGQYVYLGRPPMMTSAAEHLATMSHSKLLSARTLSFVVIEKTPTRVTSDEDDIRNTISANQAAVVPAARKTSIWDKVHKQTRRTLNKKRQTQGTRIQKKRALQTRCENTM